MRMYRQTGQSEQYLWWVVISIVLQTWKRPSAGLSNFHGCILGMFVCADSVPPLGVAQTLKLARSMIDRQINTKQTLHSCEALMLYIDLLYAQVDPTATQLKD